MKLPHNFTYLLATVVTVADMNFRRIDGPAGHIERKKKCME